MYICPVCGYPNLKEEAYDEKNIPSDEICPCCGFQFGYDDNYDLEHLSKYHTIWRDNWIKNGAEWFSRRNLKPSDWDLKDQMKNLVK
ncbi:hypothetical protein BN85412700 [Alteracholeplasma palmae J233]|uniref:Uncharacterized protein n=1 Tax=Alteracholeplasma palmae (strain ATCC 49389 / J233) TaxID=1318466 RepID=U4KLQ9_ALTPJ|nr:hypothetical protein [Alteracholeplasma palmae]CCV64847.1 hypothetical protein BN85412700 [Alteracholeplasma palmae J233]